MLANTLEHPSSGTFPIVRTDETPPVNETGLPPHSRCLPAIWSHRWQAEAIAALDPQSRGNETILVVDDDRVCQTIVKAILTKLGYMTATAGDGDEALTALELSAFTAVVTDVEMPRMNGTEFTRRARGKWPALPILIHSGNERVQEEVESVIDRFSVFKSKNDPQPLIPRLLRRLIDGG